VQAGGVGSIDLLVSEPGAGSEWIADAVKRASGGAGAVWVSAADDSVTARGMAGGPTAGIPAVPTGKPFGADENAAKAGGAPPSAIDGSGATEPALVDGFHE